MPQTVFLSEALQEFANLEGFVEVNATTVGGAVAELQARFPRITGHILDENGGIRRIANVYVNGEDIRFLQNRETPLNDRDQITIALAVIDARAATAVIDVANRLKLAKNS
jgi:molybdopterin synthase sulfur carrier subunit